MVVTQFTTDVSDKLRFCRRECFTDVSSLKRNPKINILTERKHREIIIIKKMQTLAVYKPYIQTLCTNHIYKLYVHTIYTDPMYEYKGHEHNARVTYRLVSLIHP